VHTVPSPLSERIIARAHALGFASAGVTRIEPSAYESQFRDWLGAGKHGNMSYLADHLETRLDPTRLLAGARSIIMVGDLYHSRGDPPPLAPAIDSRPRGKLARYLHGRDYHEVMKRRLHRLSDELRQEHPGAAFRTCVDFIPLLEREHAARAGLGWIGKHTLLIHPRLGSYTLLGALLTSLELNPPASQEVVTDHCGTCTRCIDACPTRAISPYSVDATRCITYLTVEQRGSIPAGLAPNLSDWIAGCDVCQEVCPHNSARPPGADTGSRHAAYAPARTDFALLDVARWDEPARHAAFHTSALKRITLAMMKRNAIIAITNALVASPADPAWGSEARELLGSLARDDTEDPVTRVTASECLNRLAKPGAR
jgi:epoxyqueuosine reductase